MHKQSCWMNLSEQDMTGSYADLTDLCIDIMHMQAVPGKWAHM